jgi:hypothetical protein
VVTAAANVSDADVVVLVGVYVTVTTAVTVDTAAFRVPPTAPPTITPIARRLAMTPNTIQKAFCGMPHIVIRAADLLFSPGVVIGTSDPEPVEG